MNILRDFEAANPKKKYRSDFEVFLRESKMEDFTSGDIETVVVSTIHKAKGKEFDNVYLMLNNPVLNGDSEKRELYVALTRAKNNLSIHLNNPVFDRFITGDVHFEKDTATYPEQELIVLQLTHKDVWLDFFTGQTMQNRIKRLQSGDTLLVENNICYTPHGQPVLKFSKAFTAKLDGLKTKGYAVKEAKINFILFWAGEATREEIKIVLPEMVLVKIPGNRAVD